MLELRSEPLGPSMPRWILYENRRNIAAFHSSSTVDLVQAALAESDPPEFAAMKNIAARLHWPMQNRADLLIWNKLRLTQQSWTRLVWALSRSGSDLIGPSSVDKLPERYNLQDAQCILHFVQSNRVSVILSLNEAINWLTETSA